MTAITRQADKTMAKKGGSDAGYSRGYKDHVG